MTKIHMSKATKITLKPFDVISKMIKPAPEYLNTLFRRGCLIHRNHMHKLDDKSGLSAMIRVPFLDSSTMSVFNTGLLGILKSERPSKLLVKARELDLPQFQSFTTRFCNHHKLDHECIKVEKYDPESTLDFLCNNTQNFDVGLLSNYVRLFVSMTKPETAGRYVKPVPAITLAEIIDQTMDVTCWEEAYQMYGTNTFIYEKRELNCPILEQAHKRGMIQNPMVIEPPSLPDEIKHKNLFSTFSSPYAVHQQCMKLPDELLEPYLKRYTTYSSEEIGEIMSEHNNEPEKHYANSKLAENMLILLGATLEECEHAREFLFYSSQWTRSQDALNLATLEKVLNCVTLPYQETIALSDLFDLVVQTNPLCKPVIDYFIECMVQRIGGIYNLSGVPQRYPISLGDQLSLENGHRDGVTILARAPSKNTDALMIKWTS